MVRVQTIALATMFIGAFALPQNAFPSHSPLPSPTPSPGHPSPSGSSVASASVRIIGKNSTKLFEGQLNNIRPKTISTTSGGAHTCGVGRGTPMDALDMVARQKLFTYDATWDASTGNFEVTQVDGEGNASWQTLVNDNFTSGQPSCSQPLGSGLTNVWWIFDPSQYQHILHLKGPSEVPGSSMYSVTITDWATGEAVQGATVLGNVSDASGNVQLLADVCGPMTFRARMPGSLMSNWIQVVADPYATRKRCVQELGG